MRNAEDARKNDQATSDHEQNTEDDELDLEAAQVRSTTYIGNPIFKIRKGTSDLFLVEEKLQDGPCRYRLRRTGYPATDIPELADQERDRQNDSKPLIDGKSAFDYISDVAWEDYANDMSALANIAFRRQTANRRKCDSYPWTRCKLIWKDGTETWETRTFTRQLFRTASHADEAIWNVAYQREKEFCLANDRAAISSNELLDVEKDSQRQTLQGQIIARPDISDVAVSANHNPVRNGEPRSSNQTCQGTEASSLNEILETVIDAFDLRDDKHEAAHPAAHYRSSSDNHSIEARSKIFDILSQYELFRRICDEIPESLDAMANFAADNGDYERHEWFLSQHKRWIDVYSDEAFISSLVSLGIARTTSICQESRNGMMYLVARGSDSLHCMVKMVDLPMVLELLRPLPWGRFMQIEAAEKQRLIELAVEALPDAEVYSPDDLENVLLMQPSPPTEDEPSSRLINYSMVLQDMSRAILHMSLGGTEWEQRLSGRGM